jgi:hypothetical protein
VIGGARKSSGKPGAVVINWMFEEVKCRKAMIGACKSFVQAEQTVNSIEARTVGDQDRKG